jgi:hypothetical protein
MANASAADFAGHNVAIFRTPGAQQPSTTQCEIMAMPSALLTDQSSMILGGGPLGVDFCSRSNAVAMRSNFFRMSLRQSMMLKSPNAVIISSM